MSRSSKVVLGLSVVLTAGTVVGVHLRQKQDQQRGPRAPAHFRPRALLPKTQLPVVRFYRRYRDRGTVALFTEPPFTHLQNGPSLSLTTSGVWCEEWACKTQNSI
ncbi:protein PET117 homolog, mitochondrial isoform X1 [Petaurus breviceps papuanus]|uniref:protein PET117 homolog, mitochondrial isoform X1 n=1 Tax=Petaurus breviceps papuanus TaxID=3040969 RepID=UPI0036D93935